MSNRNLKIPEPTLPEHALIRDSAPVPELSAGFKARVMAECSTSIAAAQRTFRLKVAGGIATVCCLTLLICLAVPPDTGADSPVAEAPTPIESTGHSLAMPSGSHSLAVDSPRPAAARNSDKTEMNELIENLNDRQKMFDANMLPKF